MRWLAAGFLGLVFFVGSIANLQAAYYTVRKGDSLIRISKLLGVKPHIIKELNPGVRWKRIRPGQRIVVPDVRGTVSYTIKKGDTLIGISHRFGVSYKLIKAYNPHVDWRKIRPGKKIVLPIGKGRAGKVALLKKNAGKNKSSVSASRKPAAVASREHGKGMVQRETGRNTERSGRDYIQLSSLLGYGVSIIQNLNPDIDWNALLMSQKLSGEEGGSPVKLNVSREKSAKEQIGKRSNRNTAHVRAKSRKSLAKLLKNRHLKPGEIGDGFYVVARGDTLSSIASKFGLTLKQLRELNPDKGRFIKPGDIIVIPGELSEKIRLSRKEGLYLPVKYLMYSEPYRVKKGDSLWKIARKFNTRVYLLKMMNNLSSNRLKVGSIIFVPERNMPGLNRLRMRYSILQEKRKSLVSYAERFLGRPYRFGGDSLTHGIDCSAFVQKIFHKFGYKLPRTAEGQYMHAGVRVPLSHIKVGDLLFFHTMGYAHVTHVGIYIGNNRFIHAAGRRSGVKISRLNRYYRKRLVAVKRVLGVTGKYVYNRHRSR